MRLIDADALTKHLEEMADNEWNKSVGSSKGLEDAIDVVESMPTIKAFTLADIEENYRKGLEKGLEESLEEREHIMGWLSKFCLHIDMADKHLSDAEALEFLEKKMKEQFGWKGGEAE